jgi:hypothetical protein
MNPRKKKTQVEQFEVYGLEKYCLCAELSFESKISNKIFLFNLLMFTFIIDRNLAWYVVYFSFSPSFCYQL